VLAFENNDQAGIVVYGNDLFRGKYQVLLDAAEAWEVRIEIFAVSGQHLTCCFRIRRGRRTVFADASPRGTLYQPELQEISCS